MRVNIHFAVPGVVASAVLVASIAGYAQQGAGAGAPAARPLIPMTAASIVFDPPSHYGENVSMMAAVEALLSKTVFTVDQDRTASTGKEVLVIAPTMSGFVQPNMYVTVEGEVFKFDAAEVARLAKTYTLDLPADLVAKYQGRPAVLATVVINNATLVDVAKRVLPPMTPAEVTLRAAMVAINTNNGGLRGGLETPDLAKVKEQVAALKKAFTDAEMFFKAQKADDASAWAADALKFIGTMESATAAATPKWEDVRTASTGLGGMCAPCHGARRERQDDGSYRFKGSR